MIFLFFSFELKTKIWTEFICMITQDSIEKFSEGFEEPIFCWNKSHWVAWLFYKINIFEPYYYWRLYFPALCSPYKILIHEETNNPFWIFEMLPFGQKTSVWTIWNLHFSIQNPEIRSPFFPLKFPTIGKTFERPWNLNLELTALRLFLKW